jgi:UDP-2-acetamido-2,6-beta-L-arabino-hexul-4-ose reductase
MKILVTGAKGFVGKNLIEELKNRKYNEIFEYDKDTDASLLEEYTKNCDFVFHLAGVNRPQIQEEFMEGNYGFTSTLLNLLKKNNNKATILLASSIQADLNNPYGLSKKAGENLLFKYGNDLGVKILVYRFPNIFGKWCKPNYNSVIATFCNNIARDLPIIVNDPTTILKLVYIDDVVEELIQALNSFENKDGVFCKVPTTHTITIGEIVNIIMSFKENRKTLNIPNMDNEFEKKLYSTYLSYLPTDQFSYPLKMNIDNRGSFTEIIRTTCSGQFSVNIIKQGITKGNHWHHSKNEKFVVVSGNGLIQFRRIDAEEVIDYYVSGNKLEVVDIPTGYTHNIANVGDDDLVVFMWANEAYNAERPDTFFLEV